MKLHVALRPLGYFYYISSFILAAFGILLFPDFVHDVFIVSWCVLAIPLLFAFSPVTNKKFPTTSFSFSFCLKLWLSQAVCFFVALLAIFLWLNIFPSYARLDFSWVAHLSYSLVLGVVASAGLCVVFSCLMRKFNQPPSAQLFFPESRINHRGAVYSNIWFRKALMNTLFLMMLLAIWIVCQRIIATAWFPPSILFFSACILFIFVKTPFFYGWLQKLIRQYHWDFGHVCLLVCLLMLVVSFIFAWCFVSTIPWVGQLDLMHLGSQAPLVLFWGTVIAITVPFGYFFAPLTMTISPRRLVLLFLVNPFLWGYVALDAYFPLLHLLQQVPNMLLLPICIAVFVVGYILLASERLARFNAVLFYDTGAKHKGAMPRIMMQSNVMILLMLIAVFSIHAFFWLQIEFLATGACVLITYFIAGGLSFLYLIRAK